MANLSFSHSLSCDMDMRCSRSGSMSEQKLRQNTGRLSTRAKVGHKVGTRHDIRVWLPARYLHDAAHESSPLWVVEEVSERMGLSVLILHNGLLPVLLHAPLRRVFSRPAALSSRQYAPKCAPTRAPGFGMRSWGVSLIASRIFHDLRHGQVVASTLFNSKLLTRKIGEFVKNRWNVRF